jgi:hypothetical protein
MIHSGNVIVPVEQNLLLPTRVVLLESLPPVQCSVGSTASLMHKPVDATQKTIIFNSCLLVFRSDLNLRIAPTNKKYYDGANSQ